jgi:hypothetical protein
VRSELTRTVSAVAAISDEANAMNVGKTGAVAACAPLSIAMTAHIAQ